MRPWWPLVAICLGTFLFLLDTTVLNVALPAIGSDLHAPLSGLQWVVNIYTLALAVLMLPFGSLADRFGARNVYVVGLTVFALASLCCALAPGTGLLIASRAVQGIGGAAMSVSTFALIGAVYRGPDRGTAMGVFGAVTGLGAAVGPMLGGVLTEYLSWRAAFLLNLPWSPAPSPSPCASSATTAGRGSTASICPAPSRSPYAPVPSSTASPGPARRAGHLPCTARSAWLPPRWPSSSSSNAAARTRCWTYGSSAGSPSRR